MDYDDVFYDLPASIDEDAGAFSLEFRDSPGLVLSDLAFTNDHVATAPVFDDTVKEYGQAEVLSQHIADVGELGDKDGESEDEENVANGVAATREILGPETRTRIEVAIPEMSLAKRSQYVSIHSEVVDFIRAEAPIKRGNTGYNVEFTDGREELVTLSQLIELENGKTALSRFSQGQDLIGEMEDMSRKRKRGEEEWIPDGFEDHDLMELDDELEDEPLDLPRGINRASNRPSRSLRSRETTRQSSHVSNHVSDDDDDLNAVDDVLPSTNTRILRTRQPKQNTLTNMFAKSEYASQDQDELLNEPRAVSSDEDDGDFALVTSDLVQKKGRSTKSRQRSKRLQARSARMRANPEPSRYQKSPDSDIEFEAPRRSARSTRNKNNMLDDALMDEDSFYIIDDKNPAVPKVISVREVFQQLPADSPFASMHMALCNSCGQSRQRGQMVHCQGCTFSYHKNCLGYRSGRDHMVTKVGDDDFVLQCRYCIGVYNKKDANAPRHSKCQGCQDHGRACAPFSEKKTARQEEKLREQNDGVDPVTPVSADLLNNSALVLARCAGCYRAWHPEHLPGPDVDLIGTDLKSERLKDFAIDWRCHECGTVKNKIHRLVAWRPVDSIKHEHDQTISYTQLNEDDKEYLIKWETASYAHCTWMPGAWVFGVGSSAMRSAFGKRDAEQNLLKYTEGEAIPDEYLMADVVLNVKYSSSVSRAKNREDELANINRVSKIFVKFQGLGYDDVVWDSPPTKDMGEIYTAYAEAFFEYVEGKYFQTEPPHKIRERIATFKKEPFTEVEAQPQGLKRGKLMGYQLEGLNWLLENYHGSRSVVLADEMGLGKTVQVVSLVTSLVQDKPHCWPFLITVPNATCPNWRREFKQWAPDLRVVTYHGGKEPQELAYKYELFPNNSSSMKAHVVIMSYDSAQDPRTRVLFKSVNWAGLVVDEGQRLKNDQNLLYVALREMKIPFRLLLTGTPLQNNKRELFNLIQFIDEKQDATKLDMEYEVLDKQTLPKLHEKIRPYFLRRTKAGVLKFLPPMAQIILPVTMTVIQEKLSKSIMAKNPELIKAMFANSKMNKKERGSLNNILMQLRKCLCHPFIYSEAIEEKHHDPAVLHRNLVEASAKLILLELMLPRLKERGHRVLIFSQFLNQLDIIEDFLTGMGYEFRRLDGQIGSLEKQRRIDAFNAPDSPVFAFLLSTRAGGVGINLATADTVIIMDPDFNPHQDMQALSRAHRIGQKKKVLCFQLMTKDSVEERIMQAGRKKMALDHALIESMDDDDLAGDDLESILKHGAQALFNDDYQKEAIHYDAASVDKLLDRTEIEQTKTNDEGSGETQFSYARVWANEKSGFEEGLAIEEENEPVPLNSSVWDSIIAQREEEARREAEANREVLGRGGRRRLAINYKTNVIDAVPLEDIGPESSDSSDDFAGADSGDDSDDDAQEAPAKDAQEASDKATHTPKINQGRKASKADKLDPKTQEVRWNGRQENTTASYADQRRSQSQIAKDQRQRRRQEQVQTNQTQLKGFVYYDSSLNPGHVDQRQQPPRPIQYGEGYTSSSRDRPDFARYVKQNYYYQPNNQAGPNSYGPVPTQLLNSTRTPAVSEAQLRVAIDRVHRSREHNPRIREEQKVALLSTLRNMSLRNSAQQNGIQQG